MKTTFDVLDILYPLVNVSTVTTLLDGKVFRTAKPPNRTTKDVVVLSLPITDKQESITQECTAVINCYAPNINDLPDSLTIKGVVDAVVDALEAYSHTSTYYVIQPTSQLMLQDQDNPDMSYGSIRADIQIQSI